MAINEYDIRDLVGAIADFSESTRIYAAFLQKMSTQYQLVAPPFPLATNNAGFILYDDMLRINRTSAEKVDRIVRQLILMSGDIETVNNYLADMSALVRPALQEAQTLGRLDFLEADHQECLAAFDAQKNKFKDALSKTGYRMSR